MCGAILTDGKCLSCDHRRCEACPVYVPKPSYDELEQDLKTAKSGWDSAIADLRKAGEICLEEIRQRETARELLRRARGFVGVVHGDSAESLAEQIDAHLNT
jgi:hypothetical protein